MATLGFTTIGSSGNSFTGGNVAAMGPWTATESGEITSVSIYTGSAQLATLGIYLYNSGNQLPSTLIAESAEITTVAGGWTTVAVSGSIVSGQSYYIGFNFAAAVVIHHNTGTKRLNYKASAYAAGDLPDTFPSSPSTTNNRDYSGYITYTPESLTGLAISTPVARKVFQRSSGVADIPITGTYTGEPTAIEARFNGGSWDVIDASPAGGTYSGTLTNQPQGQGSLEVRWANDTGVTASAAHVGIGDVYLISGQSNSVGRGTNDQFYAHATLKAAKYTDLGGWQELTDPIEGADGSVWPHVATEALASLGVPVAFISTGVGGASITSFQPAQTNYTRLLSIVTAAVGSGTGKIRRVLWWQGETDALNGMSQATYNGYLDTLAAQLMTDLGAKLLPCKLQTCTDSGTTQAEQDAINAAIEEAWNDNPNVLPGPDLTDLVTDDDFHLKTDAKLLEAGQRWWAAIEAADNPPPAPVSYVGTQPVIKEYIGSQLVTATH